MKITVSTQPNVFQSDGFIAATVVAPQLFDNEDLSRRLSTSLRVLRDVCGEGDALSRDFLMTASLCYIVDKMIRRSWSSNRWTREMEVTLPVSQPDVWNGAAEELSRTLSFLSGDAWSLRFTPLSTPHWRRRRRRQRAVAEFQADAVCLFSGGLDSLVGATDYLVANSAKKALLIGHRDGAAQEQNRIYEPLQGAFPGRSRLVRVRVGHQLVAEGLSATPENTLRSRSLVFLALGMYAARFYGPDVPLLAPENGVIALNVPLTPSRAGSCSTRTMHPFFLKSLQSVLQKVGLSNPIINTLEAKTKGEVLCECLDQATLQKAAPLSVSCSHAARRQHWKRTEAKNCGYCVPCLFRRASLHAVGADQGIEYGVDVCAGELSPRAEEVRANDLRAMLDFVRRDLSPEQLAEQIAAVAPVEKLDERAQMVWRGFEDVRALWRDKGTPEIKRWAGITPTPTTSPN